MTKTIPDKLGKTPTIRYPWQTQDLLVLPHSSAAIMLQQKPDIGFIPTEPDVVDTLLALANASAEDVLYDLGCGDGRVVITAAQRFGTRGVGIDVDPERIQEAQAQARQAGVCDRVQFRHQNLFDCDFSEATIVTLYLLPHLNLKLRPQLFRQLRPGTRIISHDFDMGDWEPDQVIQMHLPEEDPILYQWVIPSEIPAHLR